MVYEIETWKLRINLAWRTSTSTPYVYMYEVRTTCSQICGTAVAAPVVLVATALVRKLKY